MLEWENSHILISKIVKTVKSLGISCKVNKNTVKTGKLPEIDVNSKENQLNDLEPKAISNPEEQIVDEVMQLFQQVRYNSIID